MTSGEYIQAKLRAWATRKGIVLQGSEGERGARNYTLSVEDNLFGGKLSDFARKSFEEGAGRELNGAVCSMQALHSSAAMAVNLFQYWLGNREYSTLAQMLAIPSTGITSLTFERKYPVCGCPAEYGLNEPPHLDLGVDYGRHAERVGIECKLFEPYGRLEFHSLPKNYLALPNVWDDIPSWRKLAGDLTEGPAGFKRLGPAQLIRHVLGLKNGAQKDQIRLVYLFLDAPGAEAAEHRAEIEKFAQLISCDGVRFVPMTVQEFIVRCFNACREQHPVYVDYLSERYL